jgi:hypothetical protein
MINITTEELLSLRNACGLFPRRRFGKRPHVSCLYRWTTAGCRGVMLESVQVGATRCTSREAILRFIERLSQGARTIRAGPTPEPGYKRDDRDELLNAEGF